MKATKPAKLGTLEFDAIIERTEDLESEVPQYATEAGYSVSDNICLKAVSLNVTAVFSNLPVTWAKEHTASSSRVEMMCEELRKLWKSRAVMEFSAGGDVYENMCIESCSLPRKTDTGSSVYVQMTLTQVTITSSDAMNIDIKYVRGGKSSKNVGSGRSSASSASSKSSDSSSSKRSVACSLGVAAGLLKENP